MQGQRAKFNVVPGHALGDQLLGQFGTLARRDYPADDMTANDVEDHLVEGGPFGRPLELCDLPRPDLFGRSGQQFGFSVGDMMALIAALATTAAGSRYITLADGTALIAQHGAEAFGRGWMGLHRTKRQAKPPLVVREDAASVP